MTEQIEEQHVEVAQMTVDALLKHAQDMQTLADFYAGLLEVVRTGDGEEKIQAFQAIKTMQGFPVVLDTILAPYQQLIKAINREINK